jgi:hypothetical protein
MQKNQLYISGKAAQTDLASDFLHKKPPSRIISLSPAKAYYCSR